MLQVDAQGALRNSRYGDIYFNASDGAAEARHVFIEGNSLESRWRSMLSSAGARSYFVIGELGFGSGLNFLATISLWQKLMSGQESPPGLQLYYFATEAQPLTRPALRKALAAYNPFPELAAQLLEQYPDIVGEDYLLQFRLGDNDNAVQVNLVLILGDSLQALDRLEHYHSNDIGQDARPETTHNTESLVVDAWYLDGFAPAVNPDMWQRELMLKIARHSGKGSTAATFSVARAVRDNLESAGFELHRKPGFGRKREMLCATFTGNSEKNRAAPAGKAARATLHNNAFMRAGVSAQRDARGQIIVVGAGIAGCTTAARLAADGWRVHIIERAAQYGAGGSGNRAALLYARSAAQRSPLANWHEAAFHFARNFYRQINCGELLQGMLRAGESLEQRWLAAHPECEWRCNVSADKATELTGVALEQGGIFYSQAGVLLPHRVLETLLRHERVTLGYNSAVATLRPAGGHSHRWQLETEDGQSFTSDAVVLACADACASFKQTRWLPLKAMRGQTSSIAANESSAALRLALCGKGYLAPAMDGTLECGASYGSDTSDTQCSEAEHRQNLENAVDLLPALRDTRNDAKNNTSNDAAPLATITGGRVSKRCVTPDYLPLAGPVANVTAFRSEFAAVTRNARRRIDAHSDYHTGLYVNCGLGSHGFTSAPLLAELIAAEISQRPFPLGDGLRKAVHPSRFLLRELIRGVAPVYSGAQDAEHSET